MKLDWNHERYRTRDLLREYVAAEMPSYPTTNNMPLIYPSSNTNLAVLQKQLYAIASQHGFAGDIDDFLTKFGMGSGGIIRGTLADFPVPGMETNLYFNTQDEVIYYFKETTDTIDMEALSRIGGHVVGTSGQTTYLYLPVRAMPVEDIIYDCGDAAEYID